MVARARTRRAKRISGIGRRVARGRAGEGGMSPRDASGALARGTVPEVSHAAAMDRIGLVAAAAELGLSRKTLQRWRKRDGAPFGEDGSVDLEELRAWAERAGLLRGAGRPPEPDRVEGVELSADDLATLEDDVSALEDGDLVDLARRVSPAKLKALAQLCRLRREHADAEKKELENAQARRELVAIEDVKRHWRRQIQVVKSHFVALPGKLALRLVGRQHDEIYKALEDELTELLKAFAVEVPA